MTRKDMPIGTAASGTDRFSRGDSIHACEVTIDSPKENVVTRYVFRTEYILGTWVTHWVRVSRGISRGSG